MTFYVINQIALIPESRGVAVRLLYASAPQKGDCYALIEWKHVREIVKRWKAGQPWYLCCPAHHVDREVLVAIVAAADELLA